jgi:predicted dehydrogenase
MIGAGSMAVHHLEAWSKAAGVQLVAITNRTRHRAERLAREFGIPHISTSPGELISRDDVDLVSIAMPHNLHAPLALAAIDAGKHVFCEKPLATSLQDAREMWRRARERGVAAGIQFGHRVLPGLRRLRSLLHEGTIGRPEYLACSWCFDWARDPAFPLVWRFRRNEAGAGALADLGVYAIDAARWLIGEFCAVVGHVETIVSHRPIPIGSYAFDQMVRKAAAGTLQLSHEMGAVENEDECTILARFGCGAHGFLRASRVRSEQKLLVAGSRGELLWRLDGDRVWERRGNQPAFVECEPAKETSSRTFVDQFVDDIHQDTNLGPSFRDGVQAQVVVEAVLKSAQAGRWTSVAEMEGADLERVSGSLSKS